MPNVTVITVNIHKALWSLELEIGNNKTIKIRLHILFVVRSSGNLNVVP